MDSNMASAFSNGNCHFLANPCRFVSNSSGFNIRSYNSIKMKRAITPRDTSERPINQVVPSLRRHPRCPRLGQRHRLSMPWSGYQANPGHPVQNLLGQLSHRREDQRLAQLQTVVNSLQRSDDEDGPCGDAMSVWTCSCPHWAERISTVEMMEQGWRVD